MITYAPHWNEAYTRVLWTASEVKDDPITIEQPEQPKLNRAQRRKLKRHIMAKARAQIRIVKRREGRDTQELRGLRCGQCGMLFIGRTQWRCQCKAIKERAA